MELEKGIRLWDKLDGKRKSLEAVIADEPEGFSPFKRIRHALATTKLQDVQYEIKMLRRELAHACDRALDAAGVPSISLTETMKSARGFLDLSDRAKEVSRACQAAANLEAIDGFANKPLSALASKWETAHAKKEIEAFAKELDSADHRIRDQLFMSLETINPRGDLLDVATIAGYFTSWENAGKLKEISDAVWDFAKGMEAKAEESLDLAWMIRKQIVRDEGLDAELVEVVGRTTGTAVTREPSLSA